MVWQEIVCGRQTIKDDPEPRNAKRDVTSNFDWHMARNVDF